MSHRLFAVLGALAVSLALVAVAVAAETKSETLKGTVSVVKAEDGKQVTVTLKAGDVVYGIKGEKAKDLEGMDKKEVEVTGKVHEADGKKFITVESVKEVVPPATK